MVLILSTTLYCCHCWSPSLPAAGVLSDTHTPHCSIRTIPVQLYHHAAHSGHRKRDRDSQFGPTTPGADETGMPNSSEGPTIPSHAAKKGRIVSRDGSIQDLAGGTGSSFVPRSSSTEQDPDLTPPGTPKPASIPQSPVVAGPSTTKGTPPDTPLLDATSTLPQVNKPETSRVKEMRERVQDMTTEEGESVQANTSAAPSPPAEVLEEISELPASAAEAERTGELHHKDGDVVIDESASRSGTSLPALDLPPHAPVTNTAVSAIQNAPRFVPPPSPASSVRAETGSNIGDTDYLDSMSASRTTSRMSSMSSLRGAANSASGSTTSHLHLHSALPNTSSSSSSFDTPSDALSDISTEANPPETPRPLAEVDTPLATPVGVDGKSATSAAQLADISGPPSPAAPVLNAQGLSSNASPLVQANFGRPTSSYSPGPSNAAASASSTTSKPFVNPFSSFGSATSSPFASSAKPKQSSIPSTSSNLSTAKPLTGFGDVSSASPFASTATASKSAFDTSASQPERHEEDTTTDDTFGNREHRTESPAEVQMLTGEEDEYTQFQMPRAKLFVLEGSDWKERGVGQLRLNTKTSDGDKLSARMVMRSEAVHRLILNISLFAEMNVTLAQDKFLRFSAFEDGKLHHFTVRCANSALGTDLYNNVVDLKNMLPHALSSKSPAEDSAA
ncbi:hypothetical protein P389DRAFT_101975 [Cystobasidium minutum MCA 4210]|uniref:uncharacterized protein n=1 Tax=Cystobasidium minutum MCA 4210 TaxID=1397322 RepID=UPI0034CEF78B|eukprot:jgi/Rhomi1/101975/CE101974_1741